MNNTTKPREAYHDCRRSENGGHREVHRCACGGGQGGPVNPSGDKQSMRGSSRALRRSFFAWVRHSWFREAYASRRTRRANRAATAPSASEEVLIDLPSSDAGKCSKISGYENPEGNLGPSLDFGLGRTSGSSEVKVGCRETPPYDKRLESLGPLSSGADLRLSFEAAVDNLYTSRNLKEECLRLLNLPGQSRNRPAIRKALDHFDRIEEEACSRCYGIFTYHLGENPKIKDIVPDKDRLDKYMEANFGSLDHVDPESFGEDDLRDAAVQFSAYLSRKVWCPVPWKKFSSALNSFYKRVVSTPIERPVDERALSIASQILDAITSCGVKPDEFREKEYAPESACLEAPRALGGKRSVLYLGNPSDNLLPTIDKVVPQPIYTGGKIRTITISSARSTDYLWVNKFLGACFRRLPCSIFGGDVQEWWDRCGERLCRGELFFSGDLESATDLFDGRITAALIRQFGEKFGMEEYEIQDMLNLTVQANLVDDKDTPPECGIRQRRGQLMGSEISFPFLCILSLTAFLYKRKGTDKFLSMKPRKAFKWLLKLRDVGINGDDIVFSGPAAKAEEWIAGVAAIGGKVSRGKSLVNSFYFTVNSELWCRRGKVFCARPSFLTAINDGRKYFISPAREWDEYRKCSLLDEKARVCFNIVDRLKLDIPVRWGGLGLVNRFNPFRSALFKLKSELNRSAARRGVWVGSPGAVEEKEEISRFLKRYGEKVDCVVPRSMADAFSRTFSTKKALWSIPADEDPIARKHLIINARTIAEGSISKDELRQEYKKLMKIQKGYKVLRVPVNLIEVFQGKYLGDEPPSRHVREFDYPSDLSFVRTAVWGVTPCVP